MANSRFEYVKMFEQDRVALLDTYMVVRLDGRSFTKMCKLHNFDKPNDLKALQAMNIAAQEVCNSFVDIILAYGQSDEYSFLFSKSSDIFQRRVDKIVSCVVSLFTSAYVFNFEEITGRKLQTLPSFDGRLVCYPNEKVLKDYFSWRQADLHINNLYNTCFWELVKSGVKERKAEEMLSGTFSKDKHELLFSKFGISYGNIHEIFKKGTVLVWGEQEDEVKMKKFKELQEEKPEMKLKPPKKKKILEELNCDIIKEDFWMERFGDIFEGIDKK